jgi:hypothetical protein
MSKLRNIFKNLFLSLLLVWTVSGFAQIDRLNRAQELLQVQKKPDLARPAIDSVVLHPETRKDFTAWTTRAFIYHEIYKRTDKTKLYSPLRDTIISSLKVSYSLKPDAEYKKNNDNLMNVLAVTYFNIAKKLLQDSLNDKKSVVAYNKSRELSKIVKPDTNFTARDVEYYNFAGSIFADLFNKDNNNLKAQDAAKLAILKVLEIQPDNSSANMNLGIMYYNQAVNLSRSLDYGADISQIDAIQESMIKLAKQSEQLIDKVYKQNNKNAKAVEALYFIYRMLNENAKTEQFKEKCKELKITLD